MNYQCSNCQKEYHSFIGLYENNGRTLCLECWKKVSCCSQCGKEIKNIEGNEDWYWNTTFGKNSGESSPECANKISQKFAQKHRKHKQWKEERINRKKESERIRKTYDKAHEKAQKYWNSLNEEQKRQKIKEIEEKVIEKYNKNGSLNIYIEGNIRYDYYWEWKKENPNFSSSNINQVPISLVREFMEENNDSQNQDSTGNFQDFNPIHNSQPERERERERAGVSYRFL